MEAKDIAAERSRAGPGRGDSWLDAPQLELLCSYSFYILGFCYDLTCKASSAAEPTKTCRLSPEQAFTGFLPGASLPATCLECEQRQSALTQRILKEQPPGEVTLGRGISHSTCANWGYVWSNGVPPPGLCSHTPQRGRQARVTERVSECAGTAGFGRSCLLVNAAK